MDRLDGLQLDCLQDSWVIMYTFLAREIVRAGGLRGERVVREAVRRYGRDRGLANQKRLMDNNIKINLLTLFNEGRDRVADSRYISRVIEGTEQVRISETLICSFADVWKRYEAVDLGRMYCEEFHCAAYEAFTFGAGKINLARSMTQKGDDRCWFYHTFRPENLPEDLRPICFSEFDPNYVSPTKPQQLPERRVGFNMMWIKTYVHLLDCSVEAFGDEGTAMIARSLRAYAYEQIDVLRKVALALEQEYNIDFFEDYFPLRIVGENNLLVEYNRNNSMSLFKNCFADIVLEEVSK